MGIIGKLKTLAESKIDEAISKSQTEVATPTSHQLEHELTGRKGFVELDTATTSQGIYREPQTYLGPSVLKNMARKDSVVVAVHNALINQIANFTQPQKDRYSPGFAIKPHKPADLTREEKIQLEDPNLSTEEYEALKYELEKKKMQLQEQQEKDICRLMNFILHCGKTKADTDMTYQRHDFDRFAKLVMRDRLTYNYGAIEFIPTKDRSSIANFYAVSAGTIRYVAAKSKKHYMESILPMMENFHRGKEGLDSAKPFRYVQVLRGRPVAAWTEDEFVFEAGHPSVDPEDYGYAPGELDWLVSTVTNHLYAEGHNSQFFKSGVASKGILHIQGDNISRAQLEGFKKTWYSQLVNTRNAFRPPIIGHADKVNWVPINQSNRDLEFQEHINYLIKIITAVYQIDPAEINFDISKTSTSTLNESNNSSKMKMSRYKGLRPLLMWFQNIINNQIIPRYDEKLADQYYFEFVGLDAETRGEEVERLQKESQIYKTINEIRTEMGLGPINKGDVILAATYTQYLQMQDQNLMEGGEEGLMEGDDNADSDAELSASITKDLDSITTELESMDQEHEKQDQVEKEKQKKQTTEKSFHIDYFDSGLE